MIIRLGDTVTREGEIRVLKGIYVTGEGAIDLRDDVAIPSERIWIVIERADGSLYKETQAEFVKHQSESN